MSGRYADQLLRWFAFDHLPTDLVRAAIDAREDS